MGGIGNDALSDDLGCRFLKITFRFPIGCGLCLLATWFIVITYKWSSYIMKKLV